MRPVHFPRIPFALLALAGAGGLMLGCEEDFPPYERLESLRVLAIQSEPVTPAGGQTTLLTPLVYTPGAEPVTYAWSWCPLPGSANDGYPCEVPEAQLQQLLGATGFTAPPYDLGTQATAQFPVTFDPAVLRPLCRQEGADAGMPADAAASEIPAFINCDDGFPILIKLIVTTPTDQVETVRTLNLQLDPAAPPNTNPAFDGPLVAVLPVEKTNQTLEVAFDEGGTVALPRSRATTIKASVSLSQSEPYLDRDDFGNTMPVNERLFLTWFVESGSTSPERTSFLPDRVPLEDALTSEWTPASVPDYAPALSRIIVVLRDSRGGVSWTSGVARLVEAPQE